MMIPRIPLWAVLLCLATLCFGIADHDLWSPDEPREAAIGLEMANGPDRLIPRLAGYPFVEKPPLYYWLSAGAIRLAGNLIGPTAAARGLSALAAAGCLLLTFLATRSYLGKNGALAVTLILVTFYGLWRGAHWIIIDTVLTFFITGAVFLFFGGLDRARKPLILAAYLLAGAAFLTKGPIAWVTIFFPWAIIYYFYRDRIRKELILHLCGLILMIGPTLVWVILFRLRAGPDLWWAWFWDNQFGRFLGTSTHLGNLKGPGYYFWLFPLILLPWTPALIGWVAGRGWRRLREYPPGRRNLVLISLAWLAGSFVVLSVSGTKREPYLYPLLPAAAILVFEGIRIGPRWTRIVLLVVSAIFVLPMAVFSFFAIDWIDQRVVTGLTVQPIALIGTAVSLYALFRLKSNPIARTAVIAAVFYLGYMLIAHPIFNKVWSYKAVTEAMAEAIPPGYEDRVGIWMSDEHTPALFFFYSGLKLTRITGEPDEWMRNVLEGKDPRFKLAIVHRYDRFRKEPERWPEWKVLAEKQKGRRRIYALIAGPDFTPLPLAEVD